MAMPTVWTPEKEQYVKDNFEKLTQYKISIHLGISRASIQRKIRELNLINEPKQGMLKQVKVIPKGSLARALGVSFGAWGSG